MFNLIHSEMERKYKYGAVAYMKLLQLQEKVNDLETLFILSGHYAETYAPMVDILSTTIGHMLEQLEFKYK